MFYETDGASKRSVALKGFVAINIGMADAALAFVAIIDNRRRTGG
jgi:hypothetical protein